MKSLFAFFAVVLFTVQSCSSQVPKGVPGMIPEFTFYTLKENRPLTRTGLAVKGNVVFIFFDPGCSHCRNEIRAIGENFQKFKNVTFYLISQQDRPLVRDFMNTYGSLIQGKPNVHVLIDSRYEFIEKFYPVQYPAMYIYGENRKLKSYLDGETPIAKMITAINK